MKTENMKTEKRKFKTRIKAFSLIELSIVVLVIGLIIVGVLGGKKLVNLSNLSKARALTNSSPVNGIEDLGLWLETVSKDSFLKSETTDGAAISTWNDINPQNNYKSNVTQTVALNKPIYVENAINGLPALSFDGTNTLLSTTINNFNSARYTMFMVFQRRSGDQMFLLHPINGSNFIRWLIFANGNVQYDDNNDQCNGNIGAYVSPTSYIYTISQSTNKLAYLNGVQQCTSSLTTYTNIANPVTIYIGNVNGPQIFNGYIGEIIIFNRDLPDFERQQVEKYLSKKWGIKLP